ncbi:hypothetical protein EJO69_08740 [Flaviflexus salsibiostraticola]|uniref:Uncharacterized protein n=1 Tax=Flaviflexus salsibiostraticola TaxID=1282737 RepID=A0A3S8ZA85_9ACTO|nr:hypothetical protein [Flaviflexus salsibiostraticola]AZN30382.1 hypothetical protein EJO69_08740 [Flaviflexus salsibiostraticola]
MVAHRLSIRAVDLVDILVYVVVLGLFVQLLPQVISESFSLTLLTALLMKVALEIIMSAKKRAVARLTGAHTLAARAVAGVAILLLLPGSKFVILWATEAAFAGSVSLGGFYAVTVLIAKLTLARFAVRLIIREPQESVAAAA